MALSAGRVRYGTYVDDGRQSLKQNGIQEVRGSTPLGSTKEKHLHEAVFGRCFTFVGGDQRGVLRPKYDQWISANAFPLAEKLIEFVSGISLQCGHDVAVGVESDTDP
jgi:hypothetical protein